MFELFTDSARRILVFAQEEARNLQHHYIGTEHLLLALLRENKGLAASALRQLGIRHAEARDEVEDLIGVGPHPLDRDGHIPFTPRVKRALEKALAESKKMGHNYIGTEHLLLGLCGLTDGVGIQVLARLGADLARLRQVVKDSMS